MSSPESSPGKRGVEKCLIHQSSPLSDGEKIIMRKRVHSVFDTEESDSSSSSSDEFEKAPDCLDDLKDMGLKPSCKAGVAHSIENQAVSTSPPVAALVDNQSDETPTQVEYYDFTQILKSQEELRKVAQQMADYTEKSSVQTSPKQQEQQRDDKPARKGRPTPRSSKENNVNVESTDVDVEELLRVGEQMKQRKITKSKRKYNKTLLNDSKQEDDMVVVPDKQEGCSEEVRSQGVEITIPLPSIHLKRKKNLDLRNRIEIARRYNESRRLYQIDLHKASLLGCLAHGFCLNSLANTEEIQALALSIVPSNSFYPPSSTTMAYAEKITKWFMKQMPVDNSKSIVSEDIIIDDFRRGKASNMTCIVVMFVAFCRQLDLKCRLLISLQPCPLKPPSSEMMRVPKEPEETSDNEDVSLESPPKKAKAGPSTSLKRAKQGNTGGISSKMSKSGPSKNKKKRKQSKSDTKHKTPPGGTKNNSKNKLNRRVISDDSETDEAPSEGESSKKGMDIWAELYIEDEGVWAPADLSRGQVNNCTAIGKGVTSPLAYIVAWNKNDTIKDLTRRYSTLWLTTIPKLRVDPAWWKKTLKPWAPRKTKLEKLEDKQLDEEEASCPIPTRIQECKNHPFFALERHLLKYEAIFPPDAKPIGFIRGEAVYSRVCVAELYSKESWMRQGKAVKVNEEPYKVVKSRPKYSKATSSVIKDLPLPLYGYWQVVDYIAPPAVNGVVPKNDYGNVELYQSSMLPSGAVHLQVPGIAKIAKQLGIDFAPAVVGWEFYNGSSHPRIEGIVACEEHQDTLLDAWNAAYDNDIVKKKLKSRARALKNWKKLIRSVIIRRRLEKKYKVDLSNVKVK